MRKLNNQGAALIISLSVLSFFMVLSVGFALLTITELNNARRYYSSTAAFWLAEAGINLFIKNPRLLDEAESQEIPYGEGTILLTKDDSLISKRVVISMGSVGGSQRKVRIEYPLNVPEVFDNAINVKGDIKTTGNKATVLFNDKTRLSGKSRNLSKSSILFFEDKQENVGENDVSLIYPDMNQNGIVDEFDDFVKFNQKMVLNYPKSEILYIKGNGTYTITPDPSFAGKKIIYFDGSEGGGDVNIQLGGLWGDNQNLTIISTGTVTLNQTGTFGKDSQLNIIAWSGYIETAVLPGSHSGMIFTHGPAIFDETYDTSVSEGCLVANGGVMLGEIWSTKTFNYADPRKNGIVPPGFEGILGGEKSTAYSYVPSSWREI